MIEIETGAVAAVAAHLRRSASTLSLRDLFFPPRRRGILGTSLAHGGLDAALPAHVCGKCAWLKKCKNVTVHELRGCSDSSSRRRTATVSSGSACPCRFFIGEAAHAP